MAKQYFGSSSTFRLLVLLPFLLLLAGGSLGFLSVTHETNARIHAIKQERTVRAQAVCKAENDVRTAIRSLIAQLLASARKSPETVRVGRIVTEQMRNLDCRNFR